MRKFQLLLVCLSLAIAEAPEAKLLMVVSGDGASDRLVLYLDDSAATPLTLIAKAEGLQIVGLVGSGDASTPIFAFVQSGDLVDLYRWDRSGILVGTVPIDLNISSATGDFAVGQIVFASELDEPTIFRDLWSVEADQNGAIAYIGASDYLLAQSDDGETFTQLKGVVVDEGSGDIFVGVEVTKGATQGCFSRIVRLPGDRSASSIVGQAGLEFCNFVDLIQDPASGTSKGTNVLWVAQRDGIREVSIDSASNTVADSLDFFIPLSGEEIHSMSYSEHIEDSVFVLTEDEVTTTSSVVEVDVASLQEYLDRQLPPLAVGEEYRMIAVPEPTRWRLQIASLLGLAGLLGRERERSISRE